MFGWLTSLLNRKRPNRAARFSESESYKLTLGDDVFVENALRALADVGLRGNSISDGSLKQAASDIVKRWEGIFFTKMPTAGNWALIAMSGEVSSFQNALFLADHCFDGITRDDFSSLVSSIVALAGNEWNVEHIEVENSNLPGEELEYGGQVKVKITTKSDAFSFELENMKDFDWSVVARLNEILPKAVVARFAIFHDGNAHIVFLEPVQIERLNALCGQEFHYQF